jgi:hypothetical protein
MDDIFLGSRIGLKIAVSPGRRRVIGDLKVLEDRWVETPTAPGFPGSREPQIVVELKCACAGSFSIGQRT